MRDRTIYTDNTPGRAYAMHVPTDQPVNGTTARNWIIVENASGQRYNTAGPGAQGNDYLFTANTLWVCVDSQTVTVTPADDAARTRIDAALSPERTRDALLARFAATDPDGAQRLAEAIDALTEKAYDRGTISPAY